VRWSALLGVFVRSICFEIDRFSFSTASLRAHQLVRYVYPFMQDSDDLNLTFSKGTIKYYMAPVRELSITLPNEIAVTAGFLVIGKQLKCIIKLSCVDFALSLAPLLLRVCGNGLEVSSSSSGKCK